MNAGVLQKRAVYGRIYNTETLRNQEINSREPGVRSRMRGVGRAEQPCLCSSSCLMVVRFRWCNGSPFFCDAAVICHVVGGERLRCICNFTRHSSRLAVSSDLFPCARAIHRIPLCSSSARRLRAVLSPCFRKRATIYGIQEVLGNGGRRWPNYSGRR